MRILQNDEALIAERYLKEALKVANQSRCNAAHCGSVLVDKSGVIIGRGFNSPPADREDRRTCDGPYTQSEGKQKFDVTCCMHAEWRAILDALRHNQEEVPGSKLFFARAGLDGKEKLASSLHCTHCSRLVLDTGVNEFILRFADGIRSYDSVEFDRLSYEYHMS